MGCGRLRREGVGGLVGDDGEDTRAAIERGDHGGRAQVGHQGSGVLGEMATSERLSSWLAVTSSTTNRRSWTDIAVVRGDKSSKDVSEYVVVPKEVLTPVQRSRRASSRASPRPSRRAPLGLASARKKVDAPEWTAHKVLDKKLKPLT